MESLMIESHLIESSVQCDHCMAKFLIKFVKQAGMNDLEPYHCPECDKIHYVRAFSPIKKENITLISPRKDGQSSHY